MPFMRIECSLLILHGSLSEIRLNGFNSHHAGRIEVLYKGIWGTLNSLKNLFGYAEARVACRQLGYLDAFRPLNHNEVPHVSRGTIWSENIKCNGTESRLQDCNWVQGDFKHVRYRLNSGVICKMSK
jgi:deleted-in-malignant-brain-tumors protein 1